MTNLNEAVEFATHLIKQYESHANDEGRMLWARDEYQRKADCLRFLIYSATSYQNMMKEVVDHTVEG